MASASRRWVRRCRLAAPGWHRRGLRALRDPDNLRSLAGVIETPNEVVLDAALRDTGYLSDPAAVMDRCLAPLLRAAAAQFARETTSLGHRGPSSPLIIGAGAAQAMARRWSTNRVTTMTERHNAHIAATTELHETQTAGKIALMSAQATTRASLTAELAAQLVEQNTRRGSRYRRLAASIRALGGPRPPALAAEKNRDWGPS
ncbi:hypothetical protein [Gordonia jinhuaensis]|uniref:hypothetical protein n=1 Tax=Gordonia jinhuaensis TaxID=1517702 RepID=UPI0016690447|nr:hypothetical protein [Gordonia jinhuaensis]